MKNLIIKDLLNIIDAFVDDKSLMEDVNAQTHLVNDLNIDSLDVVEIVVEVESHFQISVEDELIEQIRTFGDTVEIISNKLSITS